MIILKCWFIVIPDCYISVWHYANRDRVEAGARQAGHCLVRLLEVTRLPFLKRRLFGRFITRADNPSVNQFGGLQSVFEFFPAQVGLPNGDIDNRSAAGISELRNFGRLPVTYDRVKCSDENRAAGQGLVEPVLVIRKRRDWLLSACSQ